MTSYLIDFVLLAALVVVALRSGRLMKELKTLKSSESGLAEALEQADRSINRASGAVLALKHEGIETVGDLEARIAEARAAEADLRRLVERADWHAARRAGRTPNGAEEETAQAATRAA